MTTSLESWVKRISEQDIPIFKHTVTAIAEVTQDDDSSASELAKVILQDASLTARILKIANSIAYNPSGIPINTISRAVFFIGFNTVRTISLSLAIIDALLKNRTREHVLEIMASSLHAAVQARSFSEKRGDDSPEEVFIAALLYNLGEMAFWCVAGKEGDSILELMEQKNCDAETAQQEVLGFTFKELTVGLTQDWHLGDLLHSTVNKPKLKNPRIQNIILGHELANEAVKGWHTSETRVTLGKIAQHLDISTDAVSELAHENVKKAVETAQSFGAGIAASLIPTPGAKPEVLEDEIDEQSQYPEPDPMLQLNILRDLSSMLNDKPNLNIIMETILEGVYRGIGMDRAVFAMLTPDKSLLRAKHVLGENADKFSRSFAFNINSTPTIFSFALQKNQSVWIKDANNSEFSRLLPGSLLSTLSTENFFISPVVINGRPVGLFYADRQPSGRDLDAASFESLKHFSQQACMVITHVSSQR